MHSMHAYHACISCMRADDHKRYMPALGGYRCRVHAPVRRIANPPTGGKRWTARYACTLGAEAPEQCSRERNLPARETGPRTDKTQLGTAMSALASISKESINPALVGGPRKQSMMVGCQPDDNLARDSLIERVGGDLSQGMESRTILFVQ